MRLGYGDEQVIAEFDLRSGADGGDGGAGGGTGGTGDAVEGG